MKKFKLTMTVATMCLALAVLCFGVFSATNITYTIGGSISYEVNDVFATVETDVYTSSFNNATNLKTEAEKFLTSDTVENATQTEYKYDFTTTGAESESYSNTTKMDGNTEGGIKIAYNTTNQRTYFVVISIINNGDNIISASVTGTLGENANTTFVKTNPITSLSKSNKQKIVMTFMLDDITLGMSDVNFEYVVTINNGEGEPLTGTLKCLTNGQSYDIYGGTLSTQINMDKTVYMTMEAQESQYYANVYNFEIEGVNPLKYNSIQIDYVDGLAEGGVSPDVMFYEKHITSDTLTVYDFLSDIADASMNGDTISSEIDLADANNKFCLLIPIAEEESGIKIRESSIQITLGNSEVNGDFKYTKIDKGTAWKISAKDGNISGNNGTLTIPSTYKNMPVKEISAGMLDLCGILNLQEHKKSFNVCNNITKVIIPDSIEVIGDYAFDGCKNLVEVEFTGTSKIQTLTGTFLNCSKLTTINLPNSLEYIGDFVFQDCESLVSITIPGNANFRGLGEDTFNGCTSLSSIIFSNGMASNVSEFNFGLNALDGTNINSITIPQSVKGLNVQGLNSGSNSIEEIILLGDLETESYHFGSWLFTPTGGGTATTVLSLFKAGTYTKQ